jgi:hypothetical protein
LGNRHSTNHPLGVAFKLVTGRRRTPNETFWKSHHTNSLKTLRYSHKICSFSAQTSTFLGNKIYFCCEPQKNKSTGIVSAPYLDQDILRGVADIAFEKSWRLAASIRRHWMIPNHWDSDGIISGSFDTILPLRKFLEQHRHIPPVFVDQTEAQWGIQGTGQYIICSVPGMTTTQICSTILEAD